MPPDGERWGLVSLSKRREECSCFLVYVYVIDVRLSAMVKYYSASGVCYVVCVTVGVCLGAEEHGHGEKKKQLWDLGYVTWLSSDAHSVYRCRGHLHLTSLQALEALTF